MKAKKLRTKTRTATRVARKGKLELVPHTLTDLPTMVMGRLYFAPQAFRKTLTNKEQNLAKQVGLNRPRFLRNHIWPTEERVVNKCFEGLLMAAPPAAVAAAIKAVAPSSKLVSPVLCSLRYPKLLNRVVGEPDFLLWDADRSALVIGEIKIGARSTNGKYSFDQLRKYMNLGLLARGSIGIDHVTHLIVLPNMTISDHCTDTDYWKPDVASDGRLRELADRFMTIMFTEYRLLGEHCAPWLETIDASRIKTSLDPKNPLIPIDTFVTSWQALCGRLSKACAVHHAGHLDQAIGVLRLLGEGRSPADAASDPTEKSSHQRAASTV